MKKSHKIALVAALSAVLVLAAGIGLAVAQSGGQSQPGAQTQTGPGGLGSHMARFRGHAIAGQVTKVDANSISLKTRSGQDKTVMVNTQTKYVKKGGNGSLGDVKAGGKVAILLDKNSSGNNLTARAVLIGGPAGARRPPLVGQITAINGNKVTIHTASGDQQVTIPSLSPGMKIGVMTAPDGSVQGVVFNPHGKPAGAPQASAPGSPQGPAGFMMPGPGGQGA